MKKLIAAALVAAFFISSPALAYTQAEHDACKPDAIRFCRPVLNFGMFVVLGCMKDHRAKLSKPCDAVFKSYGM